MSRQATYIRTSTASRESSTERQRAGIEQILKGRTFTVVERRGPAFFDIVDEIEAGDVKPEVILVSDVSRITRDALDLARLFAVLKKHGIELHTVTHGKIDLNRDLEDLIGLLSE